MATFDASGATAAIRFDQFNVATLVAGAAITSNATTFSIGVNPGGEFTTFSGSGFTYSGGLFSGGTINRIDRVEGMVTQFTLDGLAMPVAQFRAFVNAGNSEGFLAAALAGNDTVTGSAFDDVLGGFAGKDSLEGGNGNDTLDGGTGADTMAGGDGNDFYIVDNAKDSILADSSGIDSVQSTVSYVLAADLEHLFLTGAGKLNGTGNASANQIVGSIGANKLLGLDANDFLDGGAGNDTLDGGTGDDTMLGGAGNDVYFVGSKSDQVNESITGKAGGTDIVFSSADITLGANIENLTLIGTGPGLVANGNALNNVIVVKNATASGVVNDLHGHDGNDTIIGAAGQDALDGGSGADVMVGGGGDDFYLVDDGDKVVETLAGPSGGTDLVTYSGSKNYTLGANLERLNMTPTSGDLSGFGNGLSNKITGNFDDNLIDGKSGSDTMLGLDGDDVYVVDNALDQIDEQNGVTNGGIDTVRSFIDFNLSDNGTTVQGEFEHLLLLGKAANGTGNGLGNQLTGNAGKNFLSGLAGDDTLDGGAGNDTMLGAAGIDVYIIDSKLDVVQEAGADLGDRIISSKISVDISALGMVENIELSGKLALSATGNSGDNFITGNGGANKLLGGDGTDTLVGGLGNDTLTGGGGADRFSGGEGNDTFFVDESDLAFADYISEVQDTGIDTVISTATNSFLPSFAFAWVENLVLAAGSGASQGVGNELDNVITGNELDNNLLGVAGNDTIDGGAGNDTIQGGSGNDLINGGAGNDSITGLGSGSDTIDGGAGDDTIFGGEDADVFIVSSGNDTILFFSGDGPDLIKGFDGNSAGGQDKLDLDGLFDDFGTDTADRSARVLILDHGATVDVLVNADGNLANGYELTVATIQTKDAVTVGQDVLVGTL